MATAGPAFDVITMGRIGVDVYPLDHGVPLQDVRTFQRWLGGSPTNVAVGCARYGRRSAVVTGVGDDPFGTFCTRALREYGVDDRFVTVHQGRRTPVTFCAVMPPDDFPMYFYRDATSPDLHIRADDLDLGTIGRAGVLWVTLSGLSAEPSRTATLAALRARQGQTTILDLDFRADFWPAPAEATRWARVALGLATVAVGNREECAVATGTSEPEAAAAALRRCGVRLAVVKCGADGVVADDGDALARQEAVAVEVVNGLGAGDAFGAALCHGLLAQRRLPDLLRLASGAGAYVAARLPCSDAMPSEVQVKSLLGEEPL